MAWPLRTNILMHKSGLLLLVLAAAGAAETKQERGKRIIDEALAALGGPNFLAMKDRIEEGRAYSFYRERLSGLTRAKIYTRYLTRPEPPRPGFFGVRERQAFGKDENSAVLFLETGEGWEITWRGAKPLDQPLLDRFKDTTMRNVFYILRQRLGEAGLTVESQGTDVWMNQPVEIVDISDADNREVTVYLHHSTKLPLRQVFYRRDPLTKIRNEEVTLFSKYRDVGGGVMWPYTIQRERNGEKIFEIFSESVLINQGLKDDRFTLSANTKIVKPKR